MPRFIHGCLGLLALCFALMVYAQTFDEVKHAAEQGDAIAQAQLGFMYEKGRGVARDDTEAATWYQKAAEQGVREAQNARDAIKNGLILLPKKSAIH